MRYSLLVLCGVASLLLAPRSASASTYGSCYEVCTPSVYCDTPCFDPFRLYLGPLACGAGFQCSGVDPDPDHDGIPNNDDNCPVQYNPNQANCDGDSRGDVCDSTISDLHLVRHDFDVCDVEPAGTNLLIYSSDIYSSNCFSGSCRQSVFVRQINCSSYACQEGHCSTLSANEAQACCNASVFPRSACGRIGVNLCVPGC